jgi:hypothetical protein
VRIELGAPVVIAPALTSLDRWWHVPRQERISVVRTRTLEQELQLPTPGDWPTLCALQGTIYGYGGPIRQRRICPICHERAPAELHVPGLGPLPSREAERRQAEEDARISGPQLEAIARAHLDTGATLAELAQRVHGRLGYPTARACLHSLERQLADRLDLVIATQRVAA